MRLGRSGETSWRAWTRRSCAAGLALALFAALVHPAGAEQVDPSRFDHLKTGFPLDGEHLNLKCEQCHLHGILTGTPKQCSACHIQGNPLSAVFMPAKHIPLESAAFKAADCDTCHVTNSFQGTHFAHANVMPGTCQTCHNGINATGKGPKHLVTSVSCDACHSTVSFAGSFALYPTGHIPTTLTCTTCHNPVQFVPALMNHVGISSGCTACHAADAPATAPLTFTMSYGTVGSTTVTLTPTSQNYHPPTSAPPSHIPVAISCESCHTVPATPMAATASAAGFVGGRMNHTGITSTCARCHADGSGPFIGVTALVTASSKGPHIPISGTACENCHKSTTVPGGFAGTAMVHTGLNGLSTCANCHENNAADLGFYGLTAKLVVRPPTSGAPPNAVTPVDASHPTTGDCSQCHQSTTSFSTNIAEPANHIPVGTTACANCHVGTSAPFAPANTQMNHAGFTTTCAQCHGAGLSFYGTAQTEAGGQPMQPPGTVGTSGASNHIPYGSADCVTCHAATSNAQGGFKLSGTPVLSAAGHTAVKALSCQGCHGAGMAWYGVTSLVTPATNHIPFASAGCASCHASNFTSGGFKVTTTPVLNVAGHAAVSSLTCVSCHENNATDLGFQGVGAQIYLRPGTAAAGLSPIDNTHATGRLGTVDCAQCHNTTPPFVGNALPSAHIPLPAPAPACTTCHAAGYAVGLSVMVHSAVKSETCATCHGPGKGPFSGTSPGTGGQPMQQPGTVGTPGSGNHIPIGGNDCVSCHASVDAMTGTGFRTNTTPALSATGHAAVGALACQGCHASGMTWFLNGATMVVPPGTVGTSGAANHIALGSGDCKTCHVPNFAAGGFKVGTAPLLAAAGHAAVASVSCASCHGTGAAWYGVPALVTQLSNHIQIANAACTACHASNFVTGGFKMTTAPVLNVAAHAVVSSLTCVSCHENNATDLNFQGVGAQIYVRPGTVAAGLSPVDNAHATGTLGSADCAQCHTTTPPFQGGTMPGNHIPLGSSPVACATCHAAGYSPTLSKMVHSVVTSETCATCHGSGKGPFSGTGQGTGGQPVQPPGTVGTSGTGNHIPVSGADCAGCHAATDTESGTGFKVSTTPVLSASGHTAVTALSCQSCHAAGMAWYGVTPLVTPATNHIPMASAGCASCHASNFTTGGFKVTTTPVLNVAAHAAVSGLTCVSCHENNSTDLGFQGVATQIYLRPGAAIAGLSPIDANHATGTLGTADCSQCHNTTPPFVGNTLPTNHVPLGAAPAACATCHAAGFAVGKSIMVHSVVTSETCTTCHGAGKGPFSGTSQGTGGQPKQPPGTVGTSGAGNHIPVASADCGTTCHASTDAMTGTGFKTSTTPALSSAAHGAVSSLSCQTCHASGMAWFGVTIKTPPGTVGTPGAGNHIPIGSTACNVCHAATNYTSFAGTAMNHSGISTGCASCHNGGMAWYGVTIKTDTLTPAHIPVATTPVCEACHSASNFTAFGPGTAMNPTTHLQVPTTLEPCTTCHENGDATKFYGVTIVVRPTAAQDANHPQTGDCGNSGCHTTTPPFTGGAKPSNHIPSSATCSNCHTGYTPATTTMSHTDSVVAATACATCHNYGAGPYYGTAQGQAGGQPLQPGGTLNGPAATTQHIPFNTVACNVCHTSTTVPGGFANGTVPHTSGGGFMTYTTGKSGSSTPTCKSCHGPSGAKWQNASISTATVGSHQGSTTSQDCINCHSATGGGFGGAAAAAAKAVRLQAKPTGGLTARPGSAPAATPATPAAPTQGPIARRGTALAGSGPYSHLGMTPGNCTACHRAGGTAIAMPGSHLPTTLVCDACHRTTAWAPATYAHAGVGPGHCVTCHAGPGLWATPKPSYHFVTARSCDACHHGTASWMPATYDHLSPRYRPQTGIVRCLDCHTTNTEMVVPVQARAIGRRAAPGGAHRP